MLISTIEQMPYIYICAIHIYIYIIISLYIYMKNMHLYLHGILQLSKHFHIYGWLVNILKKQHTCSWNEILHRHYKIKLKMDLLWLNKGWNYKPSNTPIQTHIFFPPVWSFSREHSLKACAIRYITWSTTGLRWTFI